MTGAWEERWHPLREEWVIVAAHRQNRPWVGEVMARPDETVLGELMAQSHGSYGACGLGSNGTDRLVELVGGAGRAQGLHGAKITGGGSGGTVAVLARRGAAAAEAVARIAEQYAAETGRATRLFSGSSPGAASFGVLRLAMD